MFIIIILKPYLFQTQSTKRYLIAPLSHPVSVQSTIFELLLSSSSFFTQTTFASASLTDNSFATPGHSYHVSTPKRLTNLQFPIQASKQASKQDLWKAFIHLLLPVPGQLGDFITKTGLASNSIVYASHNSEGFYLQYHSNNSILLYTRVVHF